MAGTCATIGATLTHLVDADDRYLERRRTLDCCPLSVTGRNRSPCCMTGPGRRIPMNGAPDRLDAGRLDVVIRDREDVAEPRSTEGLLFL
jgi:hypothetical protein